MIRLRWIAAAAAMLAAQACGMREPTGISQVNARPTLLVTNGACAGGLCAPIEIRGIIPKFAVPGQPPAGFARLGPVRSTSACLLFPDTLTLTGFLVDSTGTPVDTTRTNWTTGDGIALTAVRASAGGFDWPIGVANEIVPAESRGWRVTLPASGVAQVVPSEPCTP